MPLPVLYALLLTGVDWNSGTFYINETLKDRANYQGVNINNRNWVILDTQVLNVIYGACFQRYFT